MTPPSSTLQVKDLALTISRSAAGATVLHVRGEIDLYTAPALREQFVSLIDTGHHHLIVDLGEVTFLDSTGLGVFISALRRVRSHDGALHLVAGHDRIRKLFRITGLDSVFALHPDLAGADTASVCQRWDTDDRRAPAPPRPRASEPRPWSGATLVK